MHALDLPHENGTVQTLDADNPCVSRFLEHCHRRKYPAKSVIIYAGDTPDVLYYVVKGSVTVLIEDDEGHEIVLAYINSGGFFGEMALISDLPRNASAKSLTDCEAFILSKENFKTLLENDPALAEQISATMVSRMKDNYNNLK